MDSQDKRINDWLETYEPIYEIVMTENIHSELLSSNVKNLALQRTGFTDTGLKYINETGWRRQYQYMLLLKSESEIDKQRLTNLDWLDRFSDWLVLQNKNKNFPILENGKKVIKVSCANAITYEQSEDGAISIYYLQLYFDIKSDNITSTSL